MVYNLFWSLHWSVHVLSVMLSIFLGYGALTGVWAGCKRLGLIVVRWYRAILFASNGFIVDRSTRFRYAVTAVKRAVVDSNKAELAKDSLAFLAVLGACVALARLLVSKFGRKSESSAAGKSKILKVFDACAALIVIPMVLVHGKDAAFALYAEVRKLATWMFELSRGFSVLRNLFSSKDDGFSGDEAIKQADDAVEELSSRLENPSSAHIIALCAYDGCEEDSLDTSKFCNKHFTAERSRGVQNRCVFRFEGMKCTRACKDLYCAVHYRFAADPTLLNVESERSNLKVGLAPLSEVEEKARHEAVDHLAASVNKQGAFDYFRDKVGGGADLTYLKNKFTDPKWILVILLVIFAIALYLYRCNYLSLPERKKANKKKAADRKARRKVHIVSDPDHAGDSVGPDADYSRDHGAADSDRDQDPYDVNNPVYGDYDIVLGPGGFVAESKDFTCKCGFKVPDKQVAASLARNMCFKCFCKSKGVNWISLCRKANCDKKCGQPHDATALKIAIDANKKNREVFSEFFNITHRPVLVDAKNGCCHVKDCPLGLQKPKPNQSKVCGIRCGGQHCMHWAECNPKVEVFQKDSPVTCLDAINSLGLATVPHINCDCTSVMNYSVVNGRVFICAHMFDQCKVHSNGCAKDCFVTLHHFDGTASDVPREKLIHSGFDLLSIDMSAALLPKCVKSIKPNRPVEAMKVVLLRRDPSNVTKIISSSGTIARAVGDGTWRYTASSDFGHCAGLVLNATNGKPVGFHNTGSALLNGFISVEEPGAIFGWSF